MFKRVPTPIASKPFRSSSFVILAWMDFRSYVRYVRYVKKNKKKSKQ